MNDKWYIHIQRGLTYDGFMPKREHWIDTMSQLDFNAPVYTTTERDKAQDFDSRDEAVLAIKEGVHPYLRTYCQAKQWVGPACDHKPKLRIVVEPQAIDAGQFPDEGAPF